MDIQFNLGCHKCQIGQITDAKGRGLTPPLGEWFQLMALDDPDLEPFWAGMGSV